MDIRRYFPADFDPRTAPLTYVVKLGPDGTEVSREPLWDRDQLIAIWEEWKLDENRLTDEPEVSSVLTRG